MALTPSPDGLGDNVLVQVLPQPNQPDWEPLFNKMFDSGKIPQKWNDMPQEYRDKQMELIKAHDAAAAAAAQKNGLKPPESLYHADMECISTPANGRSTSWVRFRISFNSLTTKLETGTAGQAPGTHWYHAHKHGSTSLHIHNGLAGAFIIESSHDGATTTSSGDSMDGETITGTTRRFIVFQQFDTSQNLERPRNPKGGGPPGQGKGIKQVLINGKLTPTITMAPGEVQLWRMVNATAGNSPGKLTRTTCSRLRDSPSNKRQRTACSSAQTITTINRSPLPTKMCLAGSRWRAGIALTYSFRRRQKPAHTCIPFKGRRNGYVFRQCHGAPVPSPAGRFPPPGP